MDKLKHTCSCRVITGQVARQIRRGTEWNRRRPVNIKNININEQVTLLVVTFHPNLPFPTGILHQHQCVINTSLQLRGALPGSPRSLSLSLKLREVVVKMANGWTKETHEGNSQCQQPYCKICTHIRTGIMFSSMTTGERFQLKATTTCWTRNVLYLIECTKCSIPYVEETENTPCIYI